MHPLFTQYLIESENVRLQSRRLAPKLEVCHWNATGFSGVGVQGRGPGLKIVGNIHRFLALKGGQGSKSGPIYTDFWLRGAECTPSIPNINIECENVRQHSRRMVPKLEACQSNPTRFSGVHVFIECHSTKSFPDIFWNFLVFYLYHSHLAYTYMYVPTFFQNVGQVGRHPQFSFMFFFWSNF